MPRIQRVKQQKRVMIRRYTGSSSIRGLSQAASTLIPLGLLWWLAVWSIGVSYWLTAAAMLLITLFTLRVFALMHECGHGSLCRSQRLNRALGFLFGVISGMPQYVWSQHHNFHHVNNGNWEKYRGPLSTLSVDEYAALTSAQQRRYRHARNIAFAPFGGFIYLIFNPRFNWMKGTLALAVHVVLAKFREPLVPMRQHAARFRTRYWDSAREYRHMTWNNIVLLAAWTAMCLWIGAPAFFTIYLVSLSFAGGAAIVLFTVQHNFENSYATDSNDWDLDRGTIEGTSFLILPTWLNWFTANIGYHHIHHLSAAIPNYRLVACHDENRHLFEDVTRIRLSQVHAALKCILWDARAQRIISVAEYQRWLPAMA